MVLRLFFNVKYRISRIDKFPCRYACTSDSIYRKPFFIRHYSSRAAPVYHGGELIGVENQTFKKDTWTNVTPKILAVVGKNLHCRKDHPLGLIKQRIVNYMYSKFINRSGTPRFSVYDNISPVVSTEQNFDSLLVPTNHPSRKKSDCYYINENVLLRGHTTAHQKELIQMGLDAFVVAGDVYRRDQIDSSHYPVFHQLDAVRLCSAHEVFHNLGPQEQGSIFESSKRNELKQECHTLEAVKLMEHEMKTCLIGLAKRLFGNEIQARWIETQFPFTHPSWELELLWKGEWMEVLGCGIMEQQIVCNAGAPDKIGWAFGLGLERLAMCLYSIPDIRLFWSEDSGFLNQFKVKSEETPITYKPISVYPQCTNDISFWLPGEQDCFSSNDFYDLVRAIGEDIVEQVCLVDDFVHPKTGRRSHCYRITYRHMEKTLTQQEVNRIHSEIEKTASEKLGVSIR